MALKLHYLPFLMIYGSSRNKGNINLLGLVLDLLTASHAINHGFLPRLAARVVSGSHCFVQSLLFLEQSVAVSGSWSGDVEAEGAALSGVTKPDG